MPAGDVEVFYVNGLWRTGVEAAETSPESYRTKDVAVRAGRELAEDLGVELIIKNQDGRLAENDPDPHGHDPRDVAG